VVYVTKKACDGRKSFGSQEVADGPVQMIHLLKVSETRPTALGVTVLESFHKFVGLIDSTNLRLLTRQNMALGVRQFCYTAAVVEEGKSLIVLCRLPIGMIGNHSSDVVEEIVVPLEADVAWEHRDVMVGYDDQCRVKLNVGHLED
jgi:hypothetical protein